MYFFVQTFVIRLNVVSWCSALGKWWSGSSCEACDAGYFGSSASVTDSHCSGACALGKFSSLINYCSLPRLIFRFCAGTYCPRGSPNATQCQIGFYCPNSTAQIACEVGKYCSASGLTESSPTAMGSYADVTGLSAGKECPAGQFCSSTGLTVTSGVCEAGYYCSGWAINAYGATMPPGGDATPNAPCTTAGTTLIDLSSMAAPL
jgi:hypothetical protein